MATTEPAWGGTVQGSVNMENLAGSLHDSSGLTLTRPHEDRDVVLANWWLLGAVIAVGWPEGSLVARCIVSELLAIDRAETVLGRWGKRLRAG